MHQPEVHISPHDDLLATDSTREISAESFLQKISKLDLTQEYLDLDDNDIDCSPMNQFVLDLIDQAKNPIEVRKLIRSKIHMKIKLKLMMHLSDDELIALLVKKQFRQSDIYSAMKDPLRAILPLLTWKDDEALFHLSRCLQRQGLSYCDQEIIPLFNLDLPLFLEQSLLSLLDRERNMVDILVQHVDADLLYSVLDKVQNKKLLTELMDYYFDPSVRIQIKNQIRKVENDSIDNSTCD